MPGCKSDHRRGLPLRVRLVMMLLCLCSGQWSCSLLVNPECSAEEDFCPYGWRCEDGDCVRVSDDDRDCDVDSDSDADTDGDSDGDGDGEIPGDWVLIRAGTFTMGSPPEEEGRYLGETEHEVTLTRDFEIRTTEVTQGEFEVVMIYNPSYFIECGPTCPVEQVSWHEAAAYCNALSDLAGLGRCYECTGSGDSVDCDPVGSPYDCRGYRLPTEAEWEYSARADDTGATYNGNLDSGHLVCEQPNPVLDSIAWFCGNSGNMTHVVGTRAPNDWGLYDMPGNVWEWCHDLWGDYSEGGVTENPSGSERGSNRVIRGGSWGYRARRCRAADRGFTGPGFHFDNLGFRPVRSRP